MSSEELLRIAERYSLPSLLANGHYVKPWIENDISTKMTFHLDTQYALFKCMHSNCIFATNDRKAMLEHLDNHLKLISILDENGKIRNDMLRKESKYLDCCYCDKHLTSCAKLVNHILDEHSSSVFQCQFCFYRTFEGDNILLHYENFHLLEEKKGILLCDGERLEVTDADLTFLESQLGKIFKSLNYKGTLLCV